MAEGDNPEQEHTGEVPEVHVRLVLPLLVPIIAFLFALLLIYGLSRVFLELNETSIGDVTMATPAALGVSLFILFAAWQMASNRTMQQWQVAMIASVAVAALTGGAIWAAVHDEGEAEVLANGDAAETPTAGTPVAAGTVSVSLIDPDWAVEVTPASAADPTTFSISNNGSLVHNLRVIRTDLDPDSLPSDSSGFQVDEDQVNVVAFISELTSGESTELAVDLETGSYVLICNIPGHYDQGMRTGFTVE